MKETFMKKCILTFASIAILLTSCSGGGGSIHEEADENDVCNLQFYVYDNASQYKRLADQFHTIHPNWTITVREDKASYFDHLKTYFGADMAPDMFYMESGEISSFIRDDCILDIQKYINKSEDLKESDLWPANDGYRYNEQTKTMGSGNLYALAKDLSADFVMIYNKSHIDEYNNTHSISLKDEIGYPSDDGVYPSETIPMTWEQNELFCHKLTLRDSKGFSRYGTVFDYIPWRHTMEWVQQQGVSLFSEDGTKFNAEDPNVIAAFTHLTNYCYGDHVSSTTLDTASVDTGVGFRSGSVSVVWSGRWAFKAYNWDSEHCDFEIGLAPGPVRNAGDKVYSTTSYVGMSIAKTCRYPGVAYKFLEYLLTSGVRQEIRNNESFNVPANKTIASSDLYLNPDDPVQKKLNNYFYNLTKEAEPLKFSQYLDTSTFEKTIALHYGATWDQTGSHKTPAEALLSAKVDIENEIQKVIHRM